MKKSDYVERFVMVMVMVKKAAFRMIYELRLKKDMNFEHDCKDGKSTFKRHLF